ncbi:hypothetical protein OEA41_006970 [Lepraria neglecta]|uniref:Transglycosylase SLT domain-containing protein n=1 Tax=Lepraria neglecta TaxID=209136 RepID=A0AAE0DNI9_9LECA|nr:hypothetical protein OEA41_006970 [Lepraria neglecta]
MVAGNDGTVDGPDEADDVLNAIAVTADAACIHRQLVLAMVMQESVGFVRAGHGDGGASNGLAQVQQTSSDTPASCYNTAVNACPYTTILEMIQDGVFGHAGSTSPQTPGIAYWLPVEGGDIARAIRGYNTGSIIDANDLAKIVATDPRTGKTYFAGTQAYVSDVANRMTGARVGLPQTPTCNLVTTPNDYVADASCSAGAAQ